MEAFKDLFHKMLEEVEGFAECRCLLLAKENDLLYLVVSGYEEFKPHFMREYSDWVKQADGVLVTVRDLLRAMRHPETPVLAKSNESILRKEEFLLKDEGKTGYRLISLKESLPSVNENDFSCCERKLLAYLENNVDAFRSLNFVICKYKTCRKCSWLMKGQSNMYRCDSHLRQVVILSEPCLTLPNWTISVPPSSGVTFGIHHEYLYAEQIIV